MKQNITITQDRLGAHFVLDGMPIGTALASGGASDSFVPVEDGVLCWTRRTASPVAEMTLRFSTDWEAEYTMIPALQYDGNRCFIKDYNEVWNEAPGNKGKAEKTPPRRTFFTGHTDPETGKPWRFGYRRMSVPGATYSEGRGVSVAMFLPPAHKEGSCALYQEPGKTVHEVSWPEQDGPAGVLEAMKPRRTFRAMLVFAPAGKPRTAWHRLLDAAWRQYYMLWAPERSQEELWNLGVTYAKLLYTEEDDGFKGFSIGFTWQDGAWRKRDIQKYEIGWCGQNTSLANSLLAHAKMTGDGEAARLGIAVLDAWVGASHHGGLIHTHYDDNVYTNGFGKTLDACNLGTAAVQLFEAEDRARALGISRTEYGKAALRICEFAMEVMEETGRIGKSWLESDLSPAVRDGSTGAFLAMALAAGAARTGRVDFLAAAELSCRYYNAELGRNGFTTAGALDVFSIDKESSIPLLKSSLMLYHLTKKPEYLSFAEDAAWYLSTWQWHYNRVFIPGSLLEQMEFNLFGGTAVSIHGGMDPFALCYVNDLMDLAGLTGNPQWAERAAGIWRHGQMCISDGDYVLDGKASRPIGSQDESVSPGYGNGRWLDAPSQWLVAWPTAFRLESLREILPEDGARRGRLL